MKSTSFPENLVHLIFQQGFSYACDLLFEESINDPFFSPSAMNHFKAQKIFVYHSERGVCCVFSDSN